VALEPLSDAVVSEICRQIEQMTGGPGSRGLCCVIGALGMLAMAYQPNHPCFIDVGRMVALLGHARARAMIEMEMELVSRGRSRPS
jgi:hypothetical protein